MSKRTFRMFVEEELGEFPNCIVGAILEWLLIISLFIDSVLAFVSNKFAIIFQLDPPCVLCTRIDRSLAGTNPSSYYNNSICESHKKDISSLAHCHAHGKLSDIRTMCDGCLLSFQKGKQSDSINTKNNDKKQSNVVNVGDLSLKLKPVKTGKETNSNSKSKSKNKGVKMSKCSCCGESFKKRTSSKACLWTPLNLRASSFAPALSPRVPLTPMGWRSDNAKKAQHISYTELKFISDDEQGGPDDDVTTDSKNDTQSAVAVLIPDSEEQNYESGPTPGFGKGNKFFGISFAESTTQKSPRYANKLSKKVSFKNSNLVPDPNGDDLPIEGNTVVHHLKRQVRADRRMLMVLYQELSEERNASSIAANNSMAMIARLQTEKASIEMEALQYQRMMEEQAEYDQEAIQILKDMLIQKEKDIKIMEEDIETYKQKFGEIKVEKRFDFETERSQISGMLNSLENLIQSSSDADSKGEDKKARMVKEMTIIKEKMSVIEEKGYQNNSTTLQKGDQRALLLTEIAQNLKKIRTKATI